MTRLAFILGFAFLLLPGIAIHPAQAQSSTTYAAPNMWGTVPGGVSVTGALDSADAHAQNGVIAGQVNAAQLGDLFGNGTNSSIYSVGSQIINSSTIYGNNNTATITPDNTSTNSGTVSNAGQIGQTNSGNSSQ